MLVVLLLILMLFVGIYKFIAVSSIRIVALEVDFFLIFFYTIYFLHDLISVKIASGNVVYFWDIVFGLLAVGIYCFIILTIHHFLPKLSKVIKLHCLCYWCFCSYTISN